jgi:hypothetical protein
LETEIEKPKWIILEERERRGEEGMCKTRPVENASNNSAVEA